MRGRAVAARCRDESGVTLIELVVAIAIIGIILVAIVVSVLMGFERSSDAENRVDRSNVAEFTARYFASDAASSAVDQAAVTACPGGGTFLSLRTNDATVVSYAVTSPAGRSSLVRRTCGASPPLELVLGSDNQALTGSGTCPPGPGATCTLAVTWVDHDGDFTLRGTRRSS